MDNIESAEARKKRLNRERQQQYRNRQRESGSCAAKAAKRRALETPQQRELRKQRDAQYHRNQRAQKTQQQTESRQAADAQAHRNQRSQESTQERQQRLLQVQEARELELLTEMSQFITQVTQFNEMNLPNVSPKSLPSCSQQVASKDSVPNKNKENLNSSRVNSNLLEHSSNTRVVNSVPITMVEILGSSKQSLKTYSTHDVCKNKSSAITNRCESISNSESKRSKGQRLCSANTKEALTNLCGTQNINESSQDSVKEETSRDSVLTSIKEIPNTSKENKRYSDFSQNATGIIDSLPVIKTEILDPPDESSRVVYEDYYSQTEPTMRSAPVIKVENLDLFQEDQKPLLPIIKIKETQTSKTINESSIAYPTSLMSNNNNIGNSKDVLETCSKVYSSPVGNKCPPPGSYKKSTSSKKRKLNFSVKVSHSKMNTNKVYSISSKPKTCGCSKKVAAMKKLCENDVKLVHQNDANQLCLCKTTNITLPDSTIPHEKAMKEFYLQNPDFGKINHLN